MMCTRIRSASPPTVHHPALSLSRTLVKVELARISRLRHLFWQIRERFWQIHQTFARLPEGNSVDLPKRTSVLQTRRRECRGQEMRARRKITFLDPPSRAHNKGPSAQSAHARAALSLGDARGMLRSIARVPTLIPKKARRANFSDQKAREIPSISPTTRVEFT